MTIFRYFPAVILALFAGPTLAADANGYSAKYECKAGGQYCNVDVSNLAALTCDQIVKTSTPWSSIDWSNRVICIEAGDHTSKGTLTLGSSGSSSSYKVLRYYRSDDSNDSPWLQSSGNRAEISKLNSNGSGYWLINRISSTNIANDYKVYIGQNGSSHHIILNRVLIEGGGGSGDGANIFFEGGNDLVLQNSVSRNCQIEKNKSHQAIQSDSVTRAYIVNNEVYDCAKGISTGFSQTNYDNVIENNDVYTTKFTDCHGNYVPDGPCSISKYAIAISSGGQPDHPSQYIHNRVWGTKWCDTNVSCSGGGASGFAFGGGAGSYVGWVFRKNNIITHSGGGFTNTSLVGYGAGSERGSTIGNIVYDIKVYNNSPLNAVNFCCSGADFKRTHEIYLNTFIDVQGLGWIGYGGVTESDVRCNVVIDSAATSDSGGAQTETDYNVYYGTKDAGEVNKKTNSLSIRVDSTNYTTGAVVRSSTIAGCSSAGDAACFLYRVTAGGTTGSSPPKWCTTLGCTVNDGSVTWQAIRGPYTFKRKLWTVAGGEAVTIPYARPHTSAQEFSSCPSSTIRPATGINDVPL